MGFAFVFPQQTQITILKFLKAVGLPQYQLSIFSNTSGFNSLQNMLWAVTSLFFLTTILWQYFKFYSDEIKHRQEKNSMSLRFLSSSDIDRIKRSISQPLRGNETKNNNDRVISKKVRWSHNWRHISRKIHNVLTESLFLFYLNNVGAT